MNDSGNTTNFSPPEVSNDAILSIQTKQLYQSINRSLFATLINACFLVFVLWPVIAHDVLTAWLIVLLIVSFVRGAIAFNFKKHSKLNPAETLCWYRRLYAGAILAAITWASTAYLLFPAEDIVRQVFLAFVLGGIIAGALSSLSYVKQLIQLFLIIVATPLIFQFFYSESEVGVVMALMFIFYLLMMLNAAERIHINLKQNILLHLESVEREHNLEQSKQRYQTILETATDSYFLYKKNGSIIDVNRQACNDLGYSRDEILSFSIKDIIDPESKYSTTIEQWMPEQYEAVTGIESSLRRKDGSSFPVEVSVGKINVQGEHLYSAFLRDITERQRIDKMKNEFISTVSHELRTPLTSIHGSLGLILGGAVGEISEKISDMLKLANNNTDRLLLLINDILDIQKIESGEMVFDFECVKLLPLLEQSVIDNNAYAEQYSVHFVITEKIATATVLADRNRILQVMANLLSNAAKFSNKGDQVEICLTHEKNNFRISITDHGQGISKSFYDKIFTKFTQYDSSDVRQKGGTGLGLNISKKIIEKHSGSIDFYSKHGAGTTFFIELKEYKGV